MSKKAPKNANVAVAAAYAGFRYSDDFDAVAARMAKAVKANANAFVAWVEKAKAGWAADLAAAA